MHGDPALAAWFVVCTGTFGAALGPWLLDRVRVSDPVAGVSLGIGGILTAALAPLFLRLLAN